MIKTDIGREKRAFATRSKTILATARALYPKQPFRMIMDRAETLILPPKLADEIRNHPHLSLRHAMLEVPLQSQFMAQSSSESRLLKDFHLNLPGFRLTADGYEILHSVIQNNLNKPQGKLSIRLRIFLSPRKSRLTRSSNRQTQLLQLCLKRRFMLCRSILVSLKVSRIQPASWIYHN